ncbi:MAG: aspartate aminotransferase [Alphaproteobacteria bacterium CG_4_10_14_0_2_um_filter_63_37]|nr:MAG: aspartate aminotransferase [Proteobacteria bacterium CG1_02_64_396]PJA25224.1 MAG: aspartate aminotransferase [Alphaproteobacteria bacterium CG_4_10_14_0_2_um_filter_63_37]
MLTLSGLSPLIDVSEFPVHSSIIAHRLSAIKPSPTMAVSARAAELKAQGVDVIGLGAGEPDFDTPEHIQQAAIAAMKAGHTRYTAAAGMPALRKAVAERISHDTGVTYLPNQTIVGSGGKQVLYNLFMATLNPGDEVIIPAPYWVSYPDMVMLAEGQPVEIDTCDDGFRLTPETLDSLITPRTKWLVLNSPSNPTGRAYTAAELSALADVIRQYPRIQIVTDDIYDRILFDGRKPAHLLHVAPDLADCTVVVNGVSKAYAMTGWRIGYAAGPKAIIDAMEIIQSQSTSNATSISQHAALAALTGPQEFIGDMVKVFQRRRDLVVDGLNAIEGIVCDRPEGAFYVFPDAKALLGKKTPDGAVIEDDLALCAYLLDVGLVAVVPGSAFGAPGYFRISYATSDELLSKAIARISDAVGKLK